MKSGRRQEEREAERLGIMFLCIFLSLPAPRVPEEPKAARRLQNEPPRRAASLYFCLWTDLPGACR